VSPAIIERSGYRDTVCLSAAWHGGYWNMGLTVKENVIPIPSCPVHSPRVNMAVACLAESLPGPHDFALRYYVQSGAQAALVVKSRQLPRTDWISPGLIQKLKDSGIEGLWLHRHPSAGKRVLAKNWWDLLWGKPRSIDRGREENTFVYGPASFRQPISSLAEKALDAAAAYLFPGTGDLFFDLYCGIGAGLVRWSRLAGLTIGVELGAESVSCARENAPLAVVYRGACRHRLPQLEDSLETMHERRLVYANPPRTGLEREVCQWIRETCRPVRLACLSCSAGTLARDLLELESGGYEVEKLIPFDFFPHTHHVETLALLRRK
jgi:tRNA/tmRNA/rRNA uracil-C5-methylase (TrmA/RlmC/RlmD family)